MLERRLIGCGMASLATAVSARAGDPGVRDDASRSVPLVPVPVADDVMASPRACLKGAPIEGAIAHSSLAGAAENSPRADGAKDGLVGIRVVFSSHGRTESMCAMKDLAEDFVLSQRVETGGSEEIAPCLPAAASAGAAHHAGFYGRDCVNLSVIDRASHPLKQSCDTFARKANRATDVPAAGWAADKEVAHVMTGATECTVPEVLPHEEVAVDPGVTCAEPLPNFTDSSAFSLDEDDLSGSGVSGGTDPGVFLSEWSRGRQIPFRT